MAFGMTKSSVVNFCQNGDEYKSLSYLQKYPPNFPSTRPHGVVLLEGYHPICPGT
jgi:hypothetical protein